MSEDSKKSIRLSKAAIEFNIGKDVIVEFLGKKGFKLDSSPNTKLNGEMYALLVKEYQGDKEVKKNADQLGNFSYKGKSITVDNAIKNEEEYEEYEEETPNIRVSGTQDNKKIRVQDLKNQEPQEVKKDNPVVINVHADKKTEQKQVVMTNEQLDNSSTQQDADVKNNDNTIIIDKVKETAKEEVIVEKNTEKKIESTIEIKTESKSKKDYNNNSGNNGIQLTVVGKIPLEEKKSKDKKDKNKNKQQTNETNKQHTAAQPKAHNEQQQTNKPEISVEKAENKTVVTQNKTTEEKQVNFIPTQFKKLEGPKIIDKIELPSERKPKAKQPVASSGDDIKSLSNKDKKKKRKRIGTDNNTNNTVGDANKNNNTNNNKNKDNKHNAGKPGEDKRNEKRKNDKFKKTAKPAVEEKVELSDEEIQKQIKETLARLSPLGKSKTSKHRREKRHNIANEMEEERLHEQEEKKILKVTEFVTANELANMMNIPVTKVISTCMSLGVFVSINQRLDAEILTLVAEEFGFKVEFISIDVQEALANNDEEDNPDDLIPRAPIVTVMGHVDHGKTKLLDSIRNANVAAGEAGGITQHIGAYEVTTASGKKIAFLDTPGHEAFTAMRARGASLTDVAIIVIAADDSVMPQTVEAINHAQAANVPIVFAINKIDKPTANVQKIYQELAQMNILVEEWGGKYQSQEISAKQGLNVDKLLDKVLLEAEFLDLQANPKKAAKGTIIESALDKGRGYVAKIMVQDGTLKVGDMVLAGTTYGKVKAMFNEQNKSVKTAGPSTPVLMLGLNGAPQAGDNFSVFDDEKEVKSIVTRRQQLQREQGLRTQKHITLDEIGRRIAIGDFKELNIIVKADVDGSSEALADSLLKLSTPEVQVNVIHKSVGAISESDILLASASNAIIVGFNVRPTLQARRLAEKEEIDIRLYSIIYTAIEEIKSAIEGMLAPEIEEVVTCNIEIREVFNISKVGRIAGCMVLDGKVNRQTKIRIIRDGIVVHTGSLGSLKRYKDDVKEVSAGFECGLNIDGYNDIKVGDIIEGYTIKEISRKL